MTQKKGNSDKNFESFLKESFSSGDVSIDTEKLNKILNEDASSDNMKSEVDISHYSSKFEDSDETSEGTVYGRFIKNGSPGKTSTDKVKEAMKENVVITDDLLSKDDDRDKDSHKKNDFREENTFDKSSFKVGLSSKMISDDDNDDTSSDNDFNRQTVKEFGNIQNDEIKAAVIGGSADVDNNDMTGGEGNDDTEDNRNVNHYDTSHYGSSEHNLFNRKYGEKERNLLEKIIDENKDKKEFSEDLVERREGLVGAVVGGFQEELRTGRGDESSGEEFVRNLMEHAAEKAAAGDELSNQSAPLKANNALNNTPNNPLNNTPNNTPNSTPNNPPNNTSKNPPNNTPSNQLNNTPNNPPSHSFTSSPSNINFKESKGQRYMTEIPHRITTASNLITTSTPSSTSRETVTPSICTNVTDAKNISQIGSRTVSATTKKPTTTKTTTKLTQTTTKPTTTKPINSTTVMSRSVSTPKLNSKQQKQTTIIQKATTKTPTTTNTPKSTTTTKPTAKTPQNLSNPTSKTTPSKPFHPSTPSSPLTPFPSLAPSQTTHLPSQTTHLPSQTTHQPHPLSSTTAVRIIDSPFNESASLKYSTSSSYCRETADRLKVLEGLRREVGVVERRRRDEGLINKNGVRGLDGRAEDVSREADRDVDGLLERIEGLEREVRSQDVILRGYQVEAERMYGELRVSRVRGVDREDDGGVVEDFLQHNTNLKTQIVKLKKQLARADKVTSENESTLSGRKVGQVFTPERRRSKGGKIVGGVDGKTRVGIEKSVKKTNVIEMVSVEEVEKVRKIGEDEVERVRRVGEEEVVRLREEMRRRDAEGKERSTKHQQDYLALKEKYRDHLNQLEGELELYRTQSEHDKNEGSQKNNNRKQNNVREGGTSDSKDGGKSELIQVGAGVDSSKGGRSVEGGGFLKDAGLIDLMESLKLQLTDNRLKEKEDEENEVMRVRVENAKLKGENFKLGEELRWKGEELRKVTEEKWKVQKNLDSTEVQQRTERQRFKNLLVSAQMADKARMNSQEGLIRNLRGELDEMGRQVEVVDGLREELRDLSDQLQASKQEALEARSLQTPSSKQLQRMRWQLEEMEGRLQQREHQLKLLCNQSMSTLESDVIKKLKQRQAEELDKWKALVAEKSRDIDHFRQEIDQLLEVMKAAKLLSGPEAPFTLDRGGMHF